MYTWYKVYEIIALAFHVCALEVVIFSQLQGTGGFCPCEYRALASVTNAMFVGSIRANMLGDCGWTP